MKCLEEARQHAEAALEELLLANHHQLGEVCRALAGPAARPRPGHKKRLREWLARVEAVARELRAARTKIERLLRE